MYATKAKQLFEQGYACSQAVVLAFKDIFNIDEETLSKLTLPFGGGLGRLRLVCGAASGVAFVIGQIYGDLEKPKVYEITRTIMEQVEKVNEYLEKMCIYYSIFKAIYVTCLFCSFVV